MDLISTTWKTAKNTFKTKPGRKEFHSKNREEKSKELDTERVDPLEKPDTETVKEIVNIGRNEKIYHEMDFTLKNPIIFSNNGNIIVRSKFSQKPPMCPESKVTRAKKSRSYGFDTVRHLVDRPVNSERNKASHATPSKSAQSTPKLERKIKDFKSESLNFFGLKSSSRNCPLLGEDLMFLDFSKKVKCRRNPEKNIIQKTCTL